MGCRGCSVYQAVGAMNVRFQPPIQKQGDTPWYRKKLTLVLLLWGGLIAFFAFYGGGWLNLQTLQENRNLLLNYAEQHYWLILGVSILIYILATALSFPGELFLSLVMGLLFGRWVGTLAIVFSATLGATLLFLAARYLFAEAAYQRLQQLKLANKIIQGFHRNAFNFLLFLRLVPLFPFWVVNLASAFTPVSTRTYILATLIGIVPGSFVFANLGQSLGQVSSLQDLLSIEVSIALGLLGLFALVPIRFKKRYV
jgi:uncharacterized membrane protein YdjX (TVP38/TMEM64 family)